jgi:hypothetical protein
LWASFPGFGDAPLELMIIWQWPGQINVVLTFLKWEATNFSCVSTLFCTDECIFKVFWAADQINTGIRRVSLSALPSPEICWGSFSEWEITSRCIWVLIVQDNDNEICAFGCCLRWLLSTVTFRRGNTAFPSHGLAAELQQRSWYVPGKLSLNSDSSTSGVRLKYAPRKEYPLWWRSS